MGNCVAGIEVNTAVSWLVLFTDLKLVVSALSVVSVCTGGVVIMTDEGD